ncbi:MAG: sugar ABC transporter ATP-binding protein [Armatimonadetes bacterium]|nr:sugar ABC transporter ATP-binding protein [Armatimonadota bacterium]
MPRLQVSDISMQFPAVLALDGVSLSFEPGEVHGIIGENGAGKSTLMRILSGLQKPTSGEISIGEPPTTVVFGGVRDAMRHGIAMIHQELNLVDTLSVAENVFLGREPTAGGRLNRKLMNGRTREWLREVNASIEPQVLVGSLSLAEKQLVEIAKALSCEASILIMDEPTAVLSEAETDALFELIARLKAKGVTVLYISHRLPEVEQICDRVTVLRDGRLITTVLRGATSPTELAKLMVGRELGEVFPVRKLSTALEPVLAVEGLGDEELLSGVSFVLHPGEILGMAGLMGSGRTEVGEALVGLRRFRAGGIRVEGRPVSIGSPKQAARLGIAYVSEDRKDAGLVLGMDVVENTTLANLDAYARPFISKDRERASTEAWVKQLDIKAGNLRAPILFLSGGNQQKVALAKWLELKPKVLILDEPTRGVDVGAKREIYQLIHDLASQGMACLMISSELQELIGLCHRILVMRHGTVVGEVQGEGATEEEIMVLAAGAEAA